jgi:hypothetical protein
MGERDLVNESVRKAVKHCFFPVFCQKFFGILDRLGLDVEANHMA